MMTSMQILDLKNRQDAKTVDRPFILVYEVNKEDIKEIPRLESRPRPVYGLHGQGSPWYDVIWLFVIDLSLMRMHGDQAQVN